MIHRARGDLALRGLPIDARTLCLLCSHLRGVVLHDDRVIVELRELGPEGVMHLTCPLLDHLRLLPRTLITLVVLNEALLSGLDREERGGLQGAGHDLRA